MRRFLLIISFLTAAPAAFAYQNALWIPTWGSAQLNSIQMNASALTESNPVWYGWNADASIAKKTNAENATWRAAMTGTQIIPTIQNTTSSGFNGSAVVAMLATDASRATHADAITQLVLSQVFDGIDIDYESVPTASRANFTAFLTTLADKLHRSGKKLSVSVYAKTGDSQNWDGPGSQDWAAIGRIADSVKIMAYDYHWSTSGPGPITPLTWLDQVATYAEAALPAQKIMMALPFYGYDWLGNSGADVGYSAAMAKATSVGATITHDANGEATYTYNGRTVYFQDATSYKAKLDLIKQKHPSIGGFTAWAAGQEDPEVWKVIRGVATNPATPPPADFAVAGQSNLAVAQNASASSTLTIVPVNGFAATASVATMLPASFRGTARVNTNSIAPNGSVTVTVTPTMSTPAGVYSIVVRFTSGALVHDQVVSVTVAAAPVGRHRSVSK